jgi:hypothetical protein
VQSDAALVGGLTDRSWRMPCPAASESPHDRASIMPRKRCVHAPRRLRLDSVFHCHDFARGLFFKRLFKFRLTEFHANSNHRS